jgi:hypothetical protein
VPSAVAKDKEQPKEKKEGWSDDASNSEDQATTK